MINRHTPTPAFAEFRHNDVVCLLGRHGNVSAGTCGRVLGRYARPTDPTYVIRFGEQLCNDVREDEIVPADDIRASHAGPLLRS